MKCKLIRPMVGINPDYDQEAAELAESMGDVYDVPKDIPYEAGRLIEHPDSYRLVQQGIAIPDDDECREAAGMSAERFEKAKAAYAKLEKGRSTGIKRFDSDPKADKKDKVTA